MFTIIAWIMFVCFTPLMIALTWVIITKPRSFNPARDTVFTIVTYVSWVASSVYLFGWF